MRAILQRVTIIAIALCTLTAPGNAQTGAPDEPDQDLLAIARWARNPTGDAATLWPGYQWPTEFIVCKYGGQTLVVSARAAGLSSVRGRAPRLVDSSAMPRALLFVTPLPSLDVACSHPSYWLSGSSAIATPYTPQLFTTRSARTATLMRVLRDQSDRSRGRSRLRTSPFRFGGEPRVGLAIVRSPDFDAHARSERAILAEAIAAPTTDLVRTHLRAMLVARDVRLHGLDVDARAKEAFNETDAGVAQWIAYRGALLARDGATDSLGALIRRDLLATPSFVTGDEVDYYSHPYRLWHVPVTGAALLLALERVAIDVAVRVDTGTTLDALLREVAR